MTVEDAVLHDLDKAGARAQDEIHCHFLTKPILYSFDVENAVKAGRLWDNKCLSQPKDRSIWPPPFLWDFMFGVAAIKNWATLESLPVLVKMADEKYHVHGAHCDSSDGSGDDDSCDAEIGEEMRDICNGYDVWDLMACIVPAHRVPSQQEEAHEKVTQWLDSGLDGSSHTL